MIAVWQPRAWRSDGRRKVPSKRWWSVSTPFRRFCSPARMTARLGAEIEFVCLSPRSGQAVRGPRMGGMIVTHDEQDVRTPQSSRPCHPKADGLERCRTDAKSALGPVPQARRLSTEVSSIPYWRIASRTSGSVMTSRSDLRYSSAQRYGTESGPVIDAISGPGIAR